MWVLLGDVVARLARGGCVRLEARPARWMFGCLNYGEVCAEWRNEADGDRWDVFAPGLERALAPSD